MNEDLILFFVLMFGMLMLVLANGRRGRPSR
jgi:hypothetical protein